jgi:dienelactone hydrolase
VLGEEPAGVTFPARHEMRGRVMTTEGWLGGFYRRPFQDPAMDAVPLAFGDDLKADLYLPKNASGKLPVVIWLHEYSYSTGYSRYRRPFFLSLTQRGYAVLAFDQIGFGSRAEQAARFYTRYPHWSLLGKMITDTRAAVDAVSALENIDANRVYLVGYALGGKVAMFTGALEPRVRGVAAVAAFTPLRTSAGSGTEGIQHYSHLHGLLPRLGFYLGKEAQLPFDYDELLTSYDERPVLVIAPELDRYAVPADVQRVTQGKAAISVASPREFNSFSRADQEAVFTWLEKISK